MNTRLRTYKQEEDISAALSPVWRDQRQLLKALHRQSNEQCSLGNLTKSPGGAAKIARKESLKSKGPQINGRVIC